MELSAPRADPGPLLLTDGQQMAFCVRGKRQRERGREGERERERGDRAGQREKKKERARDGKGEI